MRVLFACSEVAPYIKSGGLGDVTGSLPPELNRVGVETLVIAPLYGTLKRRRGFYQELEEVACYQVQVGWRHQFCRLLRVNGNVPVYFIENDFYFKREQFYGYYDDGERFVFFSQAVLAAVPYLGGVDVIHCHDWQTAAIPLLLNIYYRHLPDYSNLRTVFTIHNLRFQGRFNIRAAQELLNLGPESPCWKDLEYDDGINLMKAALFHSNWVTTVSPTYAREIRSAWYGEGLDAVLNIISDKLTGVLNGIDMDAVDPSKDERIYHPYRDASGKAVNKLAFQREYDLPQKKDALMIGVVSRLDAQKGFDLIQRVMEEILRLNVQFVLLGTQSVSPGEQPMYEYFFRNVEHRYRDKARCFIQFDVVVAQKIYAASDLFLMPSAFEPCGLSQMMAMRYGSLPLVRETGGLKDTVVPYNHVTGEGTGFSFANYNAHDMLHVIEEAERLFRNAPETWNSLVEQAMAADFSWRKSALEYKEIYERVKA